MPGRTNRRRPNPDRRRALELLASCHDGCTEAIQLAHGFTIPLLVELIRAGYATAKAERVGNMVLSTLGFGSTIVTFRNCPNNAPLAFWAGDPWYPLFPRKIN
jgi:hypothetical protein